MTDETQQTDEGTSIWTWGTRLLFVALFLAPVVSPWIDGVEDAVRTVDAGTLERAVGVGVVALVAALLVWQKRRSRGQQTDRADADRAARPGDRAERSGDGSARRTDRDVEGTGEVYAPQAHNNQQEARREGRRIQERAEEIAAADREARKR